jgi:hypothetical protein
MHNSDLVIMALPIYLVKPAKRYIQSSKSKGRAKMVLPFFFRK